MLEVDRRRVLAYWTAAHELDRRVADPPGLAMLADGEIAGTWRARAGAKGRLDVTVQAFESLPARVRKDLAAEAKRVGAARGAADVRVDYD